MIAYLSRERNLANNHPVITITGSKSESNRLLILQALFPLISIENLSKSDDTRLLHRALSDPNANEIDIHHAGTAMRFLTAYFASRSGRTLELTGSKRMKERPISILVDALRSLGAKIEYIENEGYPPLRITGSALRSEKLSIPSETSSQYISALLLIAPALPSGLELSLEGKVTSRPYIDMTCHLLNEVGCKVEFIGNIIKVPAMESANKVNITVESDWSSASYFYSIVALSEDLTISLKNYKSDSIQGDSALSEIFKSLGVQTQFLPSENIITLSKENGSVAEQIQLDLTKTPDIAQTIVVTCFGLGIDCALTGLHTLKIKETDRLIALKNEIEKLGGRVDITDSALHVYPSEIINSSITVNTFNDHRMAMAFAPLAIKESLGIEDPDVVSKSFPSYWDVISKTGIQVEFQR
jgi:3-phosphoshikimate 1-carboxyvinyltransferase